MTGPKITPTKNKTHIIYILDRSGSMASIKKATIEAFNEFLTGQKASGTKDVTFTLIQFDDQYEVVFDGVPLAEVPALTDDTFIPRGMTALLDAQGKTINSTLAAIKAMPSKDRPNKVICVTQTDGHENQSTEFTSFHIKKMVESVESEHGWEMIFLGASADATKIATDYGYQFNKALRWSASDRGVIGAASALSKGVSRYRAQSVVDASAAVAFEADERLEALGEEVDSE